MAVTPKIFETRGKIERQNRSSLFRRAVYVQTTRVMKIALDVSSAARPQSTGVAMYIRRMVEAFARVNTSSEKHAFTLVTRASRPKNLFHRLPLPARSSSTS